MGHSIHAYMHPFGHLKFFEHFVIYKFYFYFPTLTFRLRKFQILFLIFIFLIDHSMQLVIQYMHTAATASASVIHLDTYKFYNLTKLEIFQL